MITIPDRAPDIDELHQCTDLRSNHNKRWHIWAWRIDGNRWIVKTIWSRVGSEPQEPSIRIKTDGELKSLFRGKERKGYKKVDRAVTAQASSLDISNRAVADVIQLLFDEAGEHIDTYLATTVDALSSEQIAKGRRLLKLASTVWQEYQYAKVDGIPSALVDIAERFYSVIPTKLPRKISPEDTAKELCRDFYEQSERLDQLDAAVIGTTAQAEGKTALVDVLGAEVEQASDKEFSDISGAVTRQVAHQQFRNSYVESVFKVKIPSERKSFDDRGWSNRKWLYHGTSNANGRHILRSGLIIPQYAAHGSMFGRGIYFANVPSKSMLYCGSTKSRPKVLFFANVALGNQFIAADAMTGLTEPPSGYDSVIGKAGHTLSWGGARGKLRYDEFVVYRQEQQTIGYLILWR